MEAINLEILWCMVPCCYLAQPPLVLNWWLMTVLHCLPVVPVRTLLKRRTSAAGTNKWITLNTITHDIVTTCHAVGSCKHNKSLYRPLEHGKVTLKQNIMNSYFHIFKIMIRLKYIYVLSGGLCFPSISILDLMDNSINDEILLWNVRHAVGCYFCI